MADHLSDEEQVQLLKNWWKENGRFLIFAIVIALAAYFGWQWWKQYQVDYAEGAAEIFTELSEVVASANGATLSEDQEKTANFLIDQLQSDFSKSLYSANASLLSAKLLIEKNDLNAAEQELKKAVAFDDDDIKVIANLRLARVFFAQEKYDEAITIVDYETEGSFAGAYAEVKGDALFAKGEIELARAAYQQALDKLSSGASLERRLLEIKLLDLPKGGEQS